jgi:hypothetical protein
MQAFHCNGPGSIPGQVKWDLLDNVALGLLQILIPPTTPRSLITLSLMLHNLYGDITTE